VLLRRAELETCDRADRDDDLLFLPAVWPERDEAKARLGKDRLERNHRAVTELDLDLRLASRLADVPYEDLLALNPGYNKPQAPGAVRASLVVPVESADAARESFAKYFEERTAERARQKGSRRR
jgi:hypothetical protein